MSRRALLIGIDNYKRNPLAYCAKDAQAMQMPLNYPNTSSNAQVLLIIAQLVGT